MAIDRTEHAHRIAQRDLVIVQEETRRMDLLRRIHGIPQLLAIWGAVIVLGNAGWLLLFGGEAWAGIETGWVSLIGLAIVLSGWLEWHNRLRTIEAWRLWGFMIVLLAHGWAVARIVDFANTRQAAVYITAFILVGWALTALLFRARYGLMVSLLLLAMVYGGYALTRSNAMLLGWLIVGVGGSMWGIALALALWERRLKLNPQTWSDCEPEQ